MGTVEMWLSEALAQVAAILASVGMSWEGVKGFANSAFTTSLAGAFGGAYAAQKIAERSKVRDELIKEIRHINSGLIMAVTITNLALAIKNQHIKNLKNKYDEDVARYELHKANIRSGILDSKVPFRLSIDLITIPPMSSPIAALQDTVLGKTSCAGRALATVSALGDAITNYNSAVQKMNDVINTYKKKDIPEGLTVENLYLGVRNEDGSTSHEYRDTVQGLYDYTNDMIFFGIKLCEDLKKYGGSVADKNKKLLKGAQSKIVSMDFDQALKMGLVPEDSEYDKWLSGWHEADSLKKPWYKLGDRWLSLLSINVR